MSMIGGRSDGANNNGWTTIDEVASFVHSPRHVGHLPIGSRVVVYDVEHDEYREVALLSTQDGRMVIVTGDHIPHGRKRNQQ